MKPALPDPPALATTFSALSDPTRVELLRILARGEQCVCDLQNTMDAAQSRLSFHLRKLKDAGLVTHRREGRWSYYGLDPDALARLSDALAEVEALARSGAGHPAACACAGCCD
jgi:ArsR family transcriptional regulator, arsenate/arsenite/antimonite-responsive transcriptional repressor